MKLQERKGAILTMKNLYIRRTKYSNTFLFLLLFLFLPYTAKSEVTNSNVTDYSRSQREEQLCRQLEDKIKNKQDTRKFVKASLQMGYNACGVIKCAVKGGGDLKQILEGALDAGITNDVVSKCALDACAETKDRRVCASEIASIINSVAPEMCFIYPEQEFFDPHPPFDNRRGRSLSPSSF